MSTYSKRLLQVLALELLALIILFIWHDNFTVILTCVSISAIAIVRVTLEDKDEEWIMDIICQLLINRPNLTILHYLVNLPNIRLYPKMREPK